MSEPLAAATDRVAGGTGSFGSVMVRRLLGHGVGSVRVLSRDEAKQEQMRQELQDSSARFHLGDERDRNNIEAAMRDVDLVFRAAAGRMPAAEGCA